MSERKLTKEQANELYDDLQKAMNQMLANRSKQAAQTTRPASTQTATKVASQAEAKAAAKTAYGKPTAPQTKTPAGSQRSARPRFSKRGINGNIGALCVVAFFCVSKVALSALEASGVGHVEEANAVIVRAPSGPQWSKEEVKILTGLDNRRVELEERNTRLEQRESDFIARERELAVRLTELKELSEKLKIEREKGDKQRSTQMEQLANVYGSMNPPEAAHLLEQLDIQVSLSLIERMPEKRIGQILALMNPQRALELTNLLSQRKG
jgi:flagellar motility protein MotE (MotC chaperone)